MNRKGAWLARMVFPLVVACGLVATAWLPPGPDYRDLIGVWEGEHAGETLLFEFRPDGRCRLSFSQASSGSTTVVSGHAELVTSKTPIALTIRNIPQLQNPLHTIIEFPGDGVLRMAPPAPRWRLRPVSFPADSMTLSRVPTPGEGAALQRRKGPVTS